MDESGTMLTKLLAGKVVRESLNLLDKRSRFEIFLTLLIQCSISVFDLIGIFYISIIALKLSGSSLGDSGSRLESFESSFNAFLPDVGETQSIYLMFFASSFFLMKTLLSIFLFRIQLNILAKRDSKVLSNTLRSFIATKPGKLENTPAQNQITSIVSGSWIAISEIIGNFVLILTELFLITIILIYLVILDPISGGFLILYSILILGFFHFTVNFRLLRNSRIAIDSLHEQRSYLSAIQSNHREIFTMKRGRFFANQFLGYRLNYVNASKEVIYLYSIPKFLLELLAIFGLLAAVALQAILSKEDSAIFNLSILLISVIRILPSLLRLQTSISVLQNYSPVAWDFLQLRSKLSDENEVTHSPPLTKSDKGLKPISISFKNVVFQYSDSFSLKNLSIEIHEGESCALIGDNGSGKSTVLELIAGLIDADSGQILFDGYNRFAEALSGKLRIGLVSQNPKLVKGTVRENLLFGMPREQFNDDELNDTLQLVGFRLQENVDKFDLLKQIEDQGFNLSGGEQQRIAIARALLHRPNLLLLDEATSALDAKSEHLIENMIQNLKGRLTIVSVTHKLSDLSCYDRVIKLQKGNLEFYGTTLEYENVFRSDL